MDENEEPNDIDNNDEDDENSGGEQSKSGGEGLRDRARKVKGGADKARRAGNAAKQVGQGIVKFFRLIFSNPVTAKIFIIALIAIVIITVIWLVIEDNETKETSVTIDEYAAGLDATSKFKTLYETSGSMLFAKEDDIKKIADKYIENIKDKNRVKAKAFNRKFYDGDKDFTPSDSSVININDKRTFYEHVLNAEKYNFNRVNWQAYTRTNLQNGEEPTGDLDMQVDSDSGLQYPKYLGTLYSASELDFYANMLFPYLQSYIIPLAMVTGTTKGGRTGLSAEEERSYSADAYNTRFGYEILANGYHEIDYDRYELYTRTIAEEYRQYDEIITPGKVTRTCTEYVLAKDADGNVVDPSSSTVASVQNSGKICTDSTDIQYEEGTTKKYVEFPNGLGTSYYNIKDYYNSQYSGSGATERTNADGSLNVADKGNESTYQYDVTRYRGFDIKFDKEYGFTPYDITKSEMSATETPQEYNKEIIYLGTGVTGINYSPENDVAPAWTSTPGTKATTSTSDINVTSQTQAGETITVDRVWIDELSVVSSDSGEYTVDYLKDYAGATNLSDYEQRYYDRIADEDALNMIDIINSKPDIYNQYLKTGGNRSQYIGYTREYLQVSYFLLKEYLIDLAKTYGIGFMWGNTIVPYSNMALSSSGVTGETLLVSGATVIYPFTIDVINSGNLFLSDNQVSPGVYGYSGHTGIDIAYSRSAADQSGCTDKSDNSHACPFIKGPKVYTILEGTLESVTYSECNSHYNTGICNDSILSKYPNVNPNLTIRPTGGTSVTIASPDGTKTVYYHLYPDFQFYNTLAASVGTTLPIGTFIGYMGNTGNSTGLHLHIENGTTLWQKNGTRTLALLRQGMNNTTGKNINQTAVPGGGVTPPVITTAYTGSLDEKFYFYLGVAVEGMEIDSNSYFVADNEGDGTITIGPGITNVGEVSLAKKMGYGEYFPMNDGDRVPKSVILDIFYTAIDQEYAADVEKRAASAGLTLKQNQFEALVLTCYQRGVNSKAYQSLFNKIKNNSPDIQSTWEAYGGEFEGVRKRRKAEYKLFSQGIYVQPYDSPPQTYTFSTATPFSDAVAGRATVTPKR